MKGIGLTLFFLIIIRKYIDCSHFENVYNNSFTVYENVPAKEETSTVVTTNNEKNLKTDTSGKRSSVTNFSFGNVQGG